MKYFFFQTSEQLRGGDMKPTLRALAGQTFEDGTAVDVSLNVQAPKTQGESINGNRMDYPLGTFFCSMNLRKVKTSNGVEYYSVYDEKGTKDPDFHPVSSDPNFQYAAPEHRSDHMNAAFALFEAGIDPTPEEKPKPSAKTKKASAPVRLSPADKNGMAREEDPNWEEKYQGQLEDELTLFGNWIRKIFAEKKVNLPNRIVMGAVQGTFDALHRMGETLDTMMSRERFETFLKSERLTYDDFAALVGTGPHKKYLAWMYDEHQQKKVCTAVERNPDKKNELLDASMTLCQSHNIISGGMSASDGKDTLSNLKAAMKAGWTLDQMLDPETMKMGDSYPEYVKKLADGTIPLPEEAVDPGASFIDTLMADKKNSRPKDKDGFHVEENTWKILLRNLKRGVSTMLIGPSGCGKTEVILELCKKTGTPWTIVQMGTITDPTEQLVGQQRLRVNDQGHDEIYFDWSEFALAIQRPGVIILDEINRIPKNGENMLFSCLDGTRELSAFGAGSDQNRTIKVHPECVFFATANIGSIFTATKQIDAAMMNRFFAVEVGYMPMAVESKMLVYRTKIEEEDAKNISFVATQIRDMYRKDSIDNVISTRETLRCASLVKDGFPCLEAMEMCFLPVFEDGDGESDRAKVKKVIMQRFNTHA
ncbi:MAG: AAA family ATPase [Bacteroidales bacterium]|nr:AAA family ATPase [Bacteroidales bacterium]